MALICQFCVRIYIYVYLFVSVYLLSTSPSAVWNGIGLVSVAICLEKQLFAVPVCYNCNIYNCRTVQNTNWYLLCFFHNLRANNGTLHNPKCMPCCIHSMPKADRERGIFSNLCSSPHGLKIGCTHERYCMQLLWWPVPPLIAFLLLLILPSQFLLPFIFTL